MRLVTGRDGMKSWEFSHIVMLRAVGASIRRARYQQRGLCQANQCQWLRFIAPCYDVSEPMAFIWQPHFPILFFIYSRFIDLFLSCHRLGADSFALVLYIMAV